jgi:hypothetical protein
MQKRTMTVAHAGTIATVTGNPGEKAIKTLKDISARHGAVVTEESQVFAQAVCHSIHVVHRHGKVLPPGPARLPGPAQSLPLRVGPFERRHNQSLQ